MRALLAMVLMSSCLASAANPVFPGMSKRVAFTPMRLASLQVDKLVGQPAGEQVTRIVNEYGCPGDTIWLYSRPGHATRILTVACFNYGAPDIDATRAGNTFLEYPLVLVIKGEQVQRIENFAEFGYMYESGQIIGVADRDRDGDPEFLLEGTTSEGDGEETDPCSGSSGRSLAEARGARLVKLLGVVDAPCQR